MSKGAVNEESMPGICEEDLKREISLKRNQLLTFLSGVDNWEVGGSIEHHPMDDERNIDQDGVDLKEQFHDDDDEVIPTRAMVGEVEIEMVRRQMSRGKIGIGPV